MRNISSDFKQALRDDDRRYKEYADFTLTDGTILNLTNQHFWQGGFSWEDAVSSDKFEVGSAIINKATLVLNNIYEDFDEYDFFGATATIGIGLELDGVVERINIGHYTVVNQPKYNGSLITIEMYDNMYKFDKPYASSTVIFPADLDTIVRDACTRCGVTLITPDFPNKGFTVLTRPDDESITFREVIAYCAQIAGCYARCNENGYLTLKWFDQDALESAKTTDNVNGVHYIDSLYSHQFSTDDVVITGVRVSVDYEKEVQVTESGETYTRTEYATEEYLYGTDGYVISIEKNPLIDKTQVQTVATYLGTRINGFSFRTAEVTHGSDPSIEAGDVAVFIDRKENRYGTVVSKTVFSSNNAEKTNSIAEEPIRNSAARYSVETKNYVKARQLLAEEKTSRQRVEEDLSRRMDEAQGLYETQVQQTGGGVITYLHSKPLLADSDVQIQISSVGVLVTADGTAQSPTWYGLTVDGQLITSILNTTGINADWLNTGKIDSTNGRAFFDLNNGYLAIVSENGLSRIVLRGWAGAIIFQHRDSTDDDWDYSKEMGADTEDTYEVGQIYIGAGDGESCAAIQNYYIGTYANEKLLAYIDTSGRRRIAAERLDLNISTNLAQSIFTADTYNLWARASTSDSWVVRTSFNTGLIYLYDSTNLKRVTLSGNDNLLSVSTRSSTSGSWVTGASISPATLYLYNAENTKRILGYATGNYLTLAERSSTSASWVDRTTINAGYIRVLNGSGVVCGSVEIAGLYSYDSSSLKCVVLSGGGESIDFRNRASTSDSWTTSAYINGNNAGRINLYGNEVHVYYNKADQGIVVGSKTGTSSLPQIKQIFYYKNGSNTYIAFVPTSGTTYYTATTTVSDERYKKNIKDSDVSAIDVINSIRHIEFDFKESGQHIKCGYLAQQLVDVEDVFASNLDGTYFTEDHEILAYATKAIQELSEENNELKKRVERLEDEVQKLMQMLAK